MFDANHHSYLIPSRGEFRIACELFRTRTTTDGCRILSGSPWFSEPRSQRGHAIDPDEATGLPAVSTRAESTGRLAREVHPLRAAQARSRR